MDNIKQLSVSVREELVGILKTRFEKNAQRHPGIDWATVQAKLDSHPEKLWSLNEMERTGGEPDVISYDSQSGEFVFVDCAPETPKGRRSLCYDLQAWESRKENKPSNNALDMASDMGIAILSETEYQELQKLGNFDTKTSSWLETPPEIRKLGGAIFGDYRYGQVFVYHNGAESYYAARAFRGIFKV